MSSSFVRASYPMAATAPDVTGTLRTPPAWGIDPVTASSEPPTSHRDLGGSPRSPIEGGRDGSAGRRHTCSSHAAVALRDRHVRHLDPDQHDQGIDDPV